MTRSSFFTAAVAITAVAASSCHLSRTTTTIERPGSAPTMIPWAGDGEFDFLLGGPADLVWFEMRRTFGEFGLRIEDEASDGRRAFIESEPALMPREAARCHLGPGDESPRLQAVVALLRADLDDLGGGRTRASLRLQILDEARPTPSARCASTGTFERRIVERTRERLARGRGSAVAPGQRVTPGH